jgi:thiosulfate dehydrogenase [quinone] large subunit
VRTVRSLPESPSVPAWALLPLRVFLGATFVIAGLDKLLDPRFFDPSSPTSIQAQMDAFVRVSPIGGLVQLGQPYAVPIGLAIAVAEIAVGLGALTGLAFRLSAAAGAALSLLFFLTASWATRPFYYGADLPYAAGWVTLALAGHGGLLVSRRFVDWASGTPMPADPGEPVEAGPTPPRSPGRRVLLQAAVLGALALVTASLSIPLRETFGAVETTPEGSEAPEGSDVAGGSAGASSGPSANPSPAGSGTPGIAIGSTAAVSRTGASRFMVPFTAPPPLPAGDPGLIVRLADGTFVAFDAVCTHAGCTVAWDSTQRLLVCPCHDAAFDPAHEAAVLAGPTDVPLAPIPIVVDPSTGTISLRA